MALRVVEEACEFSPDLKSGVVVIESDLGGPPFTEAFYELESLSARQLAQSYAVQKGVLMACINGNVVGPYPVNAEGKELDKIKDEKTGNALPFTHPRMATSRYRISVPVCRQFV